MWKWIGGILLLVIVCVMGAAWWGYRKIAGTFEPDGSVRVAIAAPSDRVFASLSNADSAETWMAGGSKVSTGKHGPFGLGDSIRIEIKAVGSGRPVTWKISNVVPGKSISMELHSPDPGHPFVATRRDSVSQIGDSTIVVDRITASPPATGTAEQMMMSMFKVQSKVELMALKARIEGKGSRVK